MNGSPLGWLSIVRLGLVQSALGSIVMLATSMLNRIMVVELALVAMIPAGLVAWHYAVQLTRPVWGYESDMGARRTPWIIGGMGVLAMGGLVATNGVLLISGMPKTGYLLTFAGFSMIGAGVGAAGTSLLALLATQVAPTRRPAAAAITWIMMILGIVVTAGVAGAMLDPYTPDRLADVAGGVVLFAFVLTLFAVWNVERRTVRETRPVGPENDLSFREMVRDVLGDTRARHFTIFVFVSMLAYSMQDMILEPFAGLIFGYTPGQSTQLSSLQHMGTLVGMILAGVGGSAFSGRSDLSVRPWIVSGCVGSAVSLAALAMGALAGGDWPLRPFVFALGFFNGMFAVSAIAAMMQLAGAGIQQREGVRMGIWGASQAMAFGLGGFLGAAGFDASRVIFGADDTAFFAVFVGEAGLFLVAALLAFQIGKIGSPKLRPESRAGQGQRAGAST